MVLLLFLLSYTPPTPIYWGSSNGIGIENRTFSVDLLPEISQWGSKCNFKFQYNPGKFIPEFLSFEIGVEIFDPSQVFGDGIRNQVVGFLRFGYDNRFLFPYLRWEGMEMRAMIGYSHLTRTMGIDKVKNGPRSVDYGFHIAKYWNSKYATEGTIFVDSPLQGEWRKTKVIGEIIGRRKFYETGAYGARSGYRIEAAVHFALEKQYGRVFVTTMDLSFQRLSRVSGAFIPRIGYQFNTGNGLKPGPMLSIGLWVKKY